jgi:hypothetical protein
MRFFNCYSGKPGDLSQSNGCKWRLTNNQSGADTVTLVFLCNSSLQWCDCHLGCMNLSITNEMRKSINLSVHGIYKVPQRKEIGHNWFQIHTQEVFTIHWRMEFSDLIFRLDRLTCWCNLIFTRFNTLLRNQFELSNFTTLTISGICHEEYVPMQSIIFWDVTLYSPVDFRPPSSRVKAGSVYST